MDPDTAERAELGPVQRRIETRWRHDAYVRPDQPQRQVDWL